MRYLRPSYLLLLGALVAFFYYDGQDVLERGLVGYFSGLHPFFKHLALALATGFLIFAASRYAIADGERRAKKWIGVLTPGDNNPSLAGATTVQPGGDALVLADAADRIVSQLAEIRIRIAHHFDVMVYFYVRYYMAIVTFSIAAAMAAITLLFISKQGIDGANPYILNLFIVTTTCSAFYGAFPGVFRQEQNITDNKALYLQYVALEQEVLSFCVTGEDIRGVAASKRKFIHYVDQQLAKFNNIAIGFDYSKIPNFRSVFDEPSNSNAGDDTKERNARGEVQGNNESAPQTVTAVLVAKQHDETTGGGGVQQPDTRRGAQQPETKRGNGRPAGAAESNSAQQRAKDGDDDDGSPRVPAPAVSTSTAAPHAGKSTAQK